MAVAGPGSEREELRTWGEIAEYLGVSVRTAQEWEEKHGLPVYRLRGKKARVWANRSELDEWRRRSSRAPGREAEVISQAAPEKGRTRRGFRVSYVAAALGVAVLVSFGAWRALISRGPPAELRVEGNDLVVTNPTGHGLWRYAFSQPLLTAPYAFGESLRFVRWFGDLDGDGKTELLFIQHAVNRADVGAPLYCFSQDGKVRWQFIAGRSVRNRTETFSNVYFTSRFVVSRTGKVIVGSSHVHSYPFQIAILDSGGRLLGEYWHSGHLTYLQLADLEGDGTEEILAAGVNNAYGQATLVVLDRVDGASQGPPGSPLQLEDFGPSHEKAVVFFPRSCLTEKFEPYNRAVNLTVNDDLIEVQVSQVHHEHGPYTIYQLNRKLEVVGLIVSDSFHNRHKELEAEGKLDHPASAREIENLKRVRIVRGS